VTTRSLTLAVAALLLAAGKAFTQSTASETAAIPSSPKAEKISVTDAYHGVSVVDEYRWLENGDDPKVKAWVAGQNAYSQDYLSNLPQREAIVSFLKKARQQAHVQYGGFQYTGGLLFAMKFDPEKSGASWFRYNGTGEPLALPFKTQTNISLADIEVRREFATSKDGTKVPMTILMRKGTKLDGTNPAYLTGYGGYAISTTPGFLGSFGRLWFDHGGIFVDTNLRGGAEYGESWHASGNLLNKQNIFDDFAACAQHLIDAKYTSPQHLAIEGGSNGGLLMGAELTQHPQMFRVILSEVGIYDMLRVELDPNGSFNVTPRYSKPCTPIRRITT
jgi:prolyl oligopeptidase PreP (S9A serine peptidase family)